MNGKRLEQKIFHVKKASFKMKDSIYSKVGEPSARYNLTTEPIAFSQRLIATFKDINVGDKWSNNLWDCAWFNIKWTLPSSMSKTDLYLKMDLSGEACAFDSSGTPVRGLTNVESEFCRELGLPGKRYISLSELDIDKNGKLDLWIEAGNNDLFGRTSGGLLRELEIVKCRQNLRKLYYDVSFLLHVTENLKSNRALYLNVVYALEKAINCLSVDFTDDEITAANQILLPQLNRKNGDSSLFTLYATGHSHLDLAWLWPIRESKRKAVRTFSTALANLNDYPDYIYGASQPQQFEWVKTQHPLLYKKLKEQIDCGRIEPQGAMWVEADTNVSGGEALVRQFLFGKRFFKKEFNKDIKTLWLPDVFGFSAAIPQIMKKSGVENFLTIKLSWNDINTFPYHSFMWEGLGGEKVLVHMPPEGTYNSAGSPKSLVAAQSNYQELGICDKAILLYGIGDGGGGPGKEHLEYIKREKDFYGLPKVKNATSDEFFAELTKQKDILSVHKGDMYLERHQGTYTSQSRSKKYNRKIENALMETEFCTSLALMAGGEYPKQILDEIWKETLLYQFHDILPGSSIKRVYDESVERYQQMLNSLNQISTAALQTFNGTQLCAVNATSFNRTEFIKHDNIWYKADSMPYSIAKLTKVDSFKGLAVSNNIIENEFLRAEFNEDGTIKSLLDKPNAKQTLLNGSNALEVYNEFNDCWDIYMDYHITAPQHFKLVSSSASVNGAEAVMLQYYKFNKSSLTQKITLKAGEKQLVFDSEIDWNEDSKMLRAKFEPNIISDEVTCDIQFGHIKRTMKQSNDIDYAQFEICAHKWVDMSQSDYGVAILNDCKYGYRAKNGMISINLIRSQDYPCKSQDRGVHTFSYAVYPHSDICGLNVITEGYKLNRPLTIINANCVDSFISSKNMLVIIESVKRAEDDNSIIVRTYNASDLPSVTSFIMSAEISSFSEVNLIEVEQVAADSLNVTYKPFEIKTFKVSF